MEFKAYLTGITPKETPGGTKIEVKLTIQFDATLFSQLGQSFGDHVSVQVNNPQPALKFGVPKSKGFETEGM